MLKKFIYKLNVEVLGTLVIILGILSLFGYILCAVTDNNKWGELIYFVDFLFNIMMIILVIIQLYFNKQDERKRRIQILNEAADKGEELEVYLRTIYYNKLKETDCLFDHILNCIEEEKVIRFYVTISDESTGRVNIIFKTNDGEVYEVLDVV